LYDPSTPKNDRKINVLNNYLETIKYS